jgi:hypothetical protein
MPIMTKRSIAAFAVGVVPTAADKTTTPKLLKDQRSVTVQRLIHNWIRPHAILAKLIES